MKNLIEKEHSEHLKILGETIALGESRTLDMNVAQLFTHNPIEVPVIIQRSSNPGPTVLITAGIHGDEVNGPEIVRQVISHKVNIPVRGTIICIPVMNVFGFIGKSRYFPDGRDLNRVFPGVKNGSLASRFAYQFVKEVLPLADLCLDFHTGGAERYNASQIRIVDGDPLVKELADIFNAPFTLFQKQIKGSYRATCAKMNIPILLNESGKSMALDKEMAKEAVLGTKRVLNHLGMLHESLESNVPKERNLLIDKTTWIRADYSGLLHVKVVMHQLVKKGDVICTISDPYGSKSHVVKVKTSGYIININLTPLVYQGDAIFHLATKIAK